MASSNSARMGWNANTSPKLSPVQRELRRLLLGGFSLFLALAALSHHPDDPSFFTTSTDLRSRNWMGSVGSHLADLLLQSIGWTTVALIVWCAALAIRTPEARRRLAALKLIASVGTLSWIFELILPARSLGRGLNHPGGWAGSLLTEATLPLVGRAGSILTSFVALAICLVVTFEFELTASVREFGRMALAAILSAPAAILIPVGWLRKKFFQKKKKTLSEMIAASTAPARPEAASVAGESLAATPGKASPAIEERAEPAKRTSIFARKPQRAPAAPGSSSHFELPPLSLLSGKAEAKTKPVDRAWYLEKGEILVQKLKDFGVEGEVVNICPGPVITVYEFKPASGVKIKEIANLSDDLTLALSVLSVRIVAPIPGKPVVGIEIPSPHREMVFFKDVIQETGFFTSEFHIPLALGRLASGEPLVTDLAKMPHLLVAGSTGTGKSVFINTLIASLLYRYAPDQLRLILVDPKMVELSLYEDIPHLLLPVVVDSRKAAMSLRWAVDEMERRYSLMHKASVRHIDAFNEKTRQTPAADGVEPPEFLPYIVVVIDEYADLMAVVPKDVEIAITRLAQKARASGIHLVLATQRPSTDVVTGIIKANFPSRLSFRVASSIDSKTILDRTGADRLLGNGDMLLHSAGFATLRRMQGAYVADADLQKLVDFLKSQGEPDYDEGVMKAVEAVDQAEEGTSPDSAGPEDKALYDQALRLVAERGEASISLIQRHLRIGYNRAASLMEELEREGVVAPATGQSKRRQVLISPH